MFDNLKKKENENKANRKNEMHSQHKNNRGRVFHSLVP